MEIHILQGVLCLYNIFFHFFPMLSHKFPIWAPYTSAFFLEGSGKHVKVHIQYKGGKVITAPDNILSIMLYGESCSLDLSVVEFLVSKNIPVIFHRCHISRTVWMTRGNGADVRDILSMQIMKRNDMRRKNYIAQQILRAKFQDMAWCIQCPSKFFMSKSDTLSSLRRKEAQHSKRFWKIYSTSLRLPHYIRRSNVPINQALDACSKFVSGIFLRWILYHNLSPFHGFLHEATDYPALVYDLIEPYRSIIDRTVWEVFHLSGEKYLLEKSIEAMKQKLKEQVYCVQTKQIVARQELFHGIVLSLRSYLLGESSRFTIPMEGKMKGGRPQKHSWRLYGMNAGITRTYI